MLLGRPINNALRMVNMIDIISYNYVNCSIYLSPRTVIIRHKPHLSCNGFPDSVYQKLVLMSTFRQIDYRDKISLAKN